MLRRFLVSFLLIALGGFLGAVSTAYSRDRVAAAEARRVAEDVYDGWLTGWAQSRGERWVIEAQGLRDRSRACPAPDASGAPPSPSR